MLYKSIAMHKQDYSTCLLSHPAPESVVDTDPSISSVFFRDSHMSAWDSGLSVWLRPAASSLSGEPLILL